MLYSAALGCLAASGLLASPSEPFWSVCVSVSGLSSRISSWFFLRISAHRFHCLSVFCMPSAFSIATLSVFLTVVLNPWSRNSSTLACLALVLALDPQTVFFFSLSAHLRSVPSLAGRDGPGRRMCRQPAFRSVEVRCVSRGGALVP